ncbi:MAG: hypothetical protein ABSE48_16945 [Verrucomicrobiota bacterium]|jgi:hypothetical protein
MSEWAVRRSYPLANKRKIIFVVYRRQGTFFGVKNPRFHVLFRQAGALPHDADHWDINGQDNIAGCVQQNKGRQQHLRQGRYHERTRTDGELGRQSTCPISPDFNYARVQAPLPKKLAGVMKK